MTALSNKVLIVAGERQTGELLQRALGNEGFQTAVVWNPIQMLEFCRQHSPDFMVVDLGLAEAGLWSAIQGLRSIGTLANIPFIGLSATGDLELLEQAREAGFVAALPIAGGPRPVVDELLRRMEAAAAENGGEDESQHVVGRDPSLNRLREIGRDMISTSRRIEDRVAEFGEDGPELFGYIESAGRAIRKKLNEVADFSLHDKELRHDFRNMIGSVTGFAELILMEPGLSPESGRHLRRLRDLSSEFVDILDKQKAEANA